MRKTVLRLDSWRHPVMGEILGRDPDIETVQCDATDAALSAAVVGRAHVYQISSTRDEVPPDWLAGPAFLARAPRLLCVSTSGAGYDTVDVEACTRAGIAVVNQAGGNAAAVAEHTLGMLIGLSRRIVETDRRLRRERGFARLELIGSELGGKVLGLVGIGHVGRRVARLAEAFGMTVLAHDPYLPPTEIAARGAVPRPLHDLLAEADAVSLHCPRTRETVGLFGAAAFARMRPGALFVTTARGGICDEAALHEALRTGHLGGAGLDVWDQEPPPLDHPLLALDNVIASYHLAGVTREARRNMAAIAAEQILAVLEGARPPRLVNPEVWPAYAARFAATLGRPVLDIRASRPD